MKKFLFFLIAAFALTGCGKFHGTDVSIWSDGVWLIPGLLFGGALYSLYRAFLASKQPTEQQTPGWYKTYAPLPFWKQKPFIYFIILVLVGIGVVIWQNLEK